MTENKHAPLAKALSKAQGEMKNAPKDGKNPHFKSSYATLASILDAIREPLANNGLSISQPLAFQDGVVILETVLWHESGEFICSHYPVWPIKNDPQGYGSAITYARRYCLASLLGIASDDDDGEAATTPLYSSSTAAYVRHPPFTPTKPVIDSSIQVLTTMNPVLTEAQLKRLFAIARAKNWNNENVKEKMGDLFPGVKSSSLLSRTQYDELIKHIEANPNEGI